jgi:hypothetical protein
MERKRTILRSIGALLGVMVIVGSASVTLAATSSKPIVKGPAVAQPFIIFTHDGKVIGRALAPQCDPATGRCANDVHFVWGNGDCKGNYLYPPVVVVWTTNGQVEVPGGPPPTKPELAPCRANDFEFAWNELNQIKIGSWTHNGTPFARVIPPSGSNDAHIFWYGKGRYLQKAWWTTLNGNPLSGIIVPRGTNDVHFYGYSKVA